MPDQTAWRWSRHLAGAATLALTGVILVEASPAMSPRRSVSLPGCRLLTNEDLDRQVAQLSEWAAMVGYPASEGKRSGLRHERPLESPQAPRRPHGDDRRGRALTGCLRWVRHLLGAQIARPCSKRTEQGATEESVRSAPGAASCHPDDARKPKARNHVPHQERKHESTHQTRSGDASGKGTSPAETVRAGPSGSS